MIDLTEATADVKASKPNDAALQALNSPKMVGGQVDILLGIQYLAHFPKLVHSLDSGLGIYEVRLSPFSPHVAAALAGPHHSFNLMLEKVGDMVTMLTAFNRGLKQWKTQGPPPPSHLPLTMEEIKLAVAHNLEEATGIEGISEWNNPLQSLSSTARAETSLLSSSL